MHVCKANRSHCATQYLNGLVYPKCTDETEEQVKNIRMYFCLTVNLLFSWCWLGVCKWSVIKFGIRFVFAEQRVVDWCVNCEFNHFLAERDLIKVYG